MQAPTPSVNITPNNGHDARSPVLDPPIVKRNDAKPSKTSPGFFAKDTLKSALTTPPLQHLPINAPQAESLKTPVKDPDNADADPEPVVSPQPVTEPAKDSVALDGRHEEDLPAVSSAQKPPVVVEPKTSTPIDTVSSGNINPPVTSKTLSPAQPTPAQPFGPVLSKSDISISNKENADIQPPESSSQPLVPCTLVLPQPSSSEADPIKPDTPDVPKPPVDVPGTLKLPSPSTLVADPIKHDASVPEPPVHEGAVTTAHSPPSILKPSEAPVAAAELASEPAEPQELSDRLKDGPTPSSDVIKPVEVEKKSGQAPQPSKKKRPAPPDSQPVPKRVTRSRVRTAKAEPTLDVNINNTNVSFCIPLHIYLTLTDTIPFTVPIFSGQHC